MCGITAILTLVGRSAAKDLNASGAADTVNPADDLIDGEVDTQTGQCSIYSELLKHSLKYLTHRGPDFSGTWVSEDGLIGPLNGQFDLL